MGNLNLSAMGPTNSHNDPQCILHPSIWYYYLPTSFRRQKKARTFDPQHVGVYKTHRHDPFIAQKAFQTVPVHPSCRHILRQWVPPANDPGADSVLELSARYGFQFVRSCTIHESMNCKHGTFVCADLKDMQARLRHFYNSYLSACLLIWFYLLVLYEHAIQIHALVSPSLPRSLLL